MRGVGRVARSSRPAAPRIPNRLDAAQNKNILTHAVSPWWQNSHALRHLRVTRNVNAVELASILPNGETHQRDQPMYLAHKDFGPAFAPISPRRELGAYEAMWLEKG